MKFITIVTLTIVGSFLFLVAIALSLITVSHCGGTGVSALITSCSFFYLNILSLVSALLSFIIFYILLLSTFKKLPILKVNHYDSKSLFPLSH